MSTDRFMSLPAKHFYEFGAYRVDARNHLLLRDGEGVPLPPKTFDLLLALVESSGRVLPKEELMKLVWPDSFVEEGNLSHHVFTLRKALGEDGDANKYIETIPRRGYRFVAEVTEITDERTDIVLAERTRSRIVIEEESETSDIRQFASAQETSPLIITPADAQTATTKAAPASSIKLRRTRVLLLAGLILLVSTAAFSWYELSRSGKSAASKRTMKVTRVTNSGKVGTASISPDGRFIAYDENYTSGKGTLYVRQVGTNNEIQLLDSDQRVFGGTAFSADGGLIYYVSYDRNDPQGALYRIPVLGGPPTRLIGDFNSMFSLSPDGREVAFYRKDSTHKEESIVVAALDGSNERALLTRSQDSTIFSAMPAWSPEGSLIAFGASEAREAEAPAGGTSLFVADVGSGGIKQLSAERFVEIGKMIWKLDGQGLVFVALRPRVGNQLYYLSYPACEVRRITNDLLTYGNYGLGITSDSTALTADVWESSAQVWAIGENGDAGGASQLTLGDDDGGQGIASLPDGRIAYVARTNDEYDIWTAKEDGTSAKPITADSFSEGDIAAAPDGRYLFFISDRAGGSHLFRIETDGAGLKQLTFGDAHDSAPDCSPDGNWVAFASTSDGKTTLWKVPVEGGSPVQLTDYESTSPAFSPDGKMLSCILPASGRVTQGSIAVVTAEGGAPVSRFEVLPFAFLYLSARWTPDGQALVFRRTENHVVNLWQQPLKNAPPRQLTTFAADQIFNFRYSHDGKRMILSRGRVVINVVLITNFM